MIFVRCGKEWSFALCGSGAGKLFARNVSLLVPNVSVARQCRSSPRTTSSQTETSSLLVPNASIALLFQRKRLRAPRLNIMTVGVKRQQACPQSQLDGWCENQCRRVNSYSARTGTGCQYKSSSHMFCCNLGVRGDCSQGPLLLASARKHHTHFRFGVGTPCDCSAPPLNVTV